jgi:hypothetical protein
MVRRHADAPSRSPFQCRLALVRSAEGTRSEDVSGLPDHWIGGHRHPGCVHARWDEAKSASIKDLAWRSEYRRILKEWRVAAFTLESELDACFPHAKVHLLARSRQSSLVPAFRTYNRIIQYYIRLSLDECTTQGGRQGAVKAIYRYLNQQPPHGISDFPIGRVKHGPGCWKKPGTSSIRSCPSSSDLPTRTAFRMAKTSTGGVLR